MNTRKKNSKKSQVLEGHKQTGKRFIPPLRQLPKATPVSYVSDILPELIWIGLINERMGYIQGTRIFEKIVLIADKVKKNGTEGNYALMSSFNKLTTSQKKKITEHLCEEGILNIIQNSIAPLNILYDGCPLRFLGPPTDLHSREEMILTMKNCVGKTIDRSNTPGIVLYGAITISLMVTKLIHFPSGKKISDLNSIIDSPGSEEALIAASFLRATGQAMFGIHKPEKAWAKQFWDKNFELSPCEFTRDEKRT